MPPRRRAHLLPLLLLLACTLPAVPTGAQVAHDNVGRFAKTKVVADTLDGGYANGPFSAARFWQPQGGALINGTSIMLVADTQNQVIRRVDWGARSVSLLAGTQGVEGDCLDDTCPANSFRDGVGANSTFTMPYSVRMHPMQRHAFVADTRSGAIRRINLYTSRVHTVLRNLGHPTDLVAWGDSLAFCDGLNNSVWAFTGITGADMQQDDSPWATAGRLTLLSGSNDPASGMYAEAATAGADARFWEPLGITHDARRGVLYVADYRNRVIRSVDPLTGATLAVVGDRSSVVKIQDHATSPLLAALCGPTGLYYHYATDAVYFSDRNPDAIMGAMRVWYVQEGRVATIVGQAAGRLTQDGQVSNSQVGTSAIWGLVVGAGGRSSTSPDWWGFTEADRHVLRVVGNSEAQADKVPCEVGKFFNATACVLCTNRRPDLAAYITAGATGEGLCAWRCPDPPLYMPYACPEFAAPVPNAALATTDGTAQLFVCNQGFSKATASNTAPCRACPADLYCEGYNHAGTGEQACPLYSVSPVGSTSRAACTCIGGYRRTADGECALCPAGTYCPPGTDGEALACPTNSASDAGSDAEADCVCSPGFYGQNGELCLPCPPDTYCLGGSVSTACPSNTVSGAQSDSLEDCDCAPGYYGLGGAGSCTLCPADHYCIGNQATEAACPGNTSSPAGSDEQADCLCVAGYSGPAGGACDACPAGTYCPGNGVDLRLACHASSTSPALSDGADDCLCLNGFQDSADADVCGPCSSAPCPDPGAYRSDCTVLQAAPDQDSVCSLACTPPNADPSAYTWVSPGGYDAVEYRGVDDCAFDCATHYYRQDSATRPPDQVCVGCATDAGLCAVGEYLDRATQCVPGGLQDSRCVPCTNVPANAHPFLGPGTLDGNDCPWQCDLGFFSDVAGQRCVACSTNGGSGVCAAGTHRGQCVQGSGTAAGSDSLCTEQCTTAHSPATHPVGTAFAWTSPGTYDPLLYRGVDDCQLACQYLGGTGYYLTNPAEASHQQRLCGKITERGGTCVVGSYTRMATEVADTGCAACTNYPMGVGSPLPPAEPTVYAVSVAYVDYNNVYVIGGENRPALTLVRGGVYVFQVAAYADHPFMFRMGGFGSAPYFQGVDPNGTTVTFTVPLDAPGTLQYWCTAHPSTMGSTITIVGGPVRFGEVNRYSTSLNATSATAFRWRSPGSTNDPYGLQGSTCEFECYEGPLSVGGYHLDASRDHVMGQHTGGYPISGTCAPCNSSQCDEVGTYRGVCQALAHTDAGTCVDCTNLERNFSVAVGWHYLYPGEDTCMFACIDEYYHINTTCAPCETDPGPLGAGCAVGQYLDRKSLCTNNSDSFCEPCDPVTFDHGHWTGTGFDDEFCGNVPSECDPLYFSSGARTNGTLDCVLCSVDYEGCAAGTYLPPCGQGELYDAACVACSLVPPAYSQATRGLTHGVDSCSYLCDEPHYYDTLAASCGPCSTDTTACQAGEYLDACVSNSNTRGEALARQAECRPCTHLPEHAAYTGRGQVFNASNSCEWACAAGLHRVGTYASGTCEPCFAGPCAVGHYLSGCGGDGIAGGENTRDNACVACTNAPLYSAYTSNGTVVQGGTVEGRNDCAFVCNGGYVGPDAVSGECVPSDACTAACPEGQYREACTAGLGRSPLCVPCTAAPYGGTLGLAGTFNEDTCAVVCDEGWYPLPGEGSRLCCSDNSYIEDEAAVPMVCTCSAGFRVGGTVGVDGVDCVP